MLLKVMVLSDVALAATIAAVNVDSTAEKLVLAGAVVAALGVLWRNFLRPAGKIIARTVAAVDALETLPQWRVDHDERLSDVEAEVGIVVVDVSHVANDVAAIRRELGIGDDDVRRHFPAAEPSRPRRTLPARGSRPPKQDP